MESAYICKWGSSDEHHSITTYVIEIQYDLGVYALERRQPRELPSPRAHDCLAAIANRLTMAASGFSRAVIRPSPILDGTESRTWSFPHRLAEGTLLVIFHILLVCVFICWHFDSPSI